MEKRIFELVSGASGVRKEEITKQSSFINDLGMDSLDNVELMLNIEQEYSMDFPDDEVEKIKTVGDLIEYLHSVLI